MTTYELKRRFARGTSVAELAQLSGLSPGQVEARLRLTGDGLLFFEQSPARSRTGQVLVSGYLREVTTPEWDPTPQGAQLRADRLARHEGLRACANRLGLRMAELSELESGKASLGPDDWAAVLAAGREVARG